jgi:hypothetical protein
MTTCRTAFRGAGVARVGWRTTYLAKSLNCVLAIAVAAQSLLTQYCPCYCARSVAGIGVNQISNLNCDQEAACACCGRCGEDCDSTETKSDGIGAWGEVGICPCQCPRNCDCHWRHSRLPATVAGPAFDIDRDLLEAANLKGVCSHLLLSRADIGCPDSDDCRSTATRCAVLCRFTI